MNPILRNVLAIIAGVATGMIVIMIMHSLLAMIVPLPEGVNFEDPDSFKKNIHLFTSTDFIMATVVHALGTLAAAFVAAKIVVYNKMMFGIVMGIFFLVFGIMNAMELGAPTWATAMDLLLAYIPMGWVGAKLAMNFSKKE